MLVEVIFLIFDRPGNFAAHQPEQAIRWISRRSALRRSPGLSNVRFEVVDLTDLDEANVYDLVLSFDAIHDQKSPQGLLNRLHGALGRIAARVIESAVKKPPLTMRRLVGDRIVFHLIAEQQ